EIATKVALGAHAIILLDQAGWHGAKALVVPNNISLVPLPPRAPELNGQEHLAVHAPELVVKPDFQILRRYRRPLLLRLEHTHRPTLEGYVHRATRLGRSRSLNLRIGINRYFEWVSEGQYAFVAGQDFSRGGGVSFGSWQ